MSEEKRKIKHIVIRIISITALYISVATFLRGFMLVPFTLWMTIFPFPDQQGDPIVIILTVMCYVSFLCMIYLWPIAIIGLVLSIITLFTERNIYYRALPWNFLLFGILLYIVCWALGNKPP
ncbi:MAG: hypothetical protein AMJ53_08870 [Gammaproteobacteria bacterium SG8_11]|nr:MAG: hypothetical protein AMJ53_08870 [Gammaproteobacteria bacterium SG8_11]